MRPRMCTRSVRGQGQDGVALLVVLMFVLLLSAIVVEFAYETQVQASLTGNRRDEFEAYVAAKSAVAQGLGMLESDLILPAVDANGNPVSSTTGTAQQSTQQSTPPSDSMQDQWAQGLPMTPINNASMQCMITDESGKLNLNALLPDGKQENPVMVNALRALFASMGVEDDPTDAILDWLDTDDDGRPEGAESDEYQSLDSPYSCKNGPMDSIEELLLIKGVTPDLFFNCNRTETGNAAIMDPLHPELTNPGLSDLLTVHGDPQGRMNVNTARPEILEALITSANGGNASPIDTLMQERLSSPFETIADFHNRVSCPVIPLMPAAQQTLVPTTTNTTTNTTTTHPKKDKKEGATTTPLPTAGVPGAASGELLAVASNVFRLCGDGVCNGAMVRVEAYVYRTPTEARNMQTGSQHIGLSYSTNKAAGVNSFNPGSQTSSSTALEAFHILDWRVIR